jgi:hypothetical protein
MKKARFGEEQIVGTVPAAVSTSARTKGVGTVLRSHPGFDNPSYRGAGAIVVITPDGIFDAADQE